MQEEKTAAFPGAAAGSYQRKNRKLPAQKHGSQPGTLARKKFKKYVAIM
jgi:hypothetical protein